MVAFPQRLPASPAAAKIAARPASAPATGPRSNLCRHGRGHGGASRAGGCPGAPTPGPPRSAPPALAACLELLETALFLEPLGLAGIVRHPTSPMPSTVPTGTPSRARIIRTARRSPAWTSMRFLKPRAHWSSEHRVIAPAQRLDDAGVNARLRAVRPSSLWPSRSGLPSPTRPGCRGAPPPATTPPRLRHRPQSGADAGAGGWSGDERCSNRTHVHMFANIPGNHDNQSDIADRCWRMLTVADETTSSSQPQGHPGVDHRLVHDADRRSPAFQSKAPARSGQLVGAWAGDEGQGEWIWEAGCTMTVADGGVVDAVVVWARWASFLGPCHARTAGLVDGV